MRILVTGGAGFIGSNLTRSLVARGDEVVVFDNLVTFGSLRAIEDIRHRVAFIHGDIRCAEDLARVSGAFDRVYHLAASFANELSVQMPDLDMRVNADGTANVLARARALSCGLFVYAGSSSSYGAAEPPFAEDQALAPETPYAVSKHIGEEHVRASGLPFAIARLFNVYGPGDPPGPYRNAVPNIMASLNDEHASVRVFGEHATRDFTYVSDVVDVLLEIERARDRVVNIGSGIETRVVGLARQILRTLGMATDRIQLEPARPWDRVVRRAADVTRLRSLFGRVPSTPLAEGLVHTARWLRDHRYLTR